MIVCHCNVIRGDEIRDAVRELFGRDAHSVITPGVVFRCCGARPQCGSCMPNFARHIDEIVEVLISAPHACSETCNRSKVAPSPIGSDRDEGNKKVIEYLNRGLRSELTAVNQYWLHYRLLENWGFTRAAKKEREESIEEMHHADRFVDRIIFLDGHPNLQTLDPLMIGTSLKEVLECDLKAEYGARTLYTEARKVCRDVEDFVSMELFEDLLKDEEGHIDHLETELDLLKTIGAENYGLLQAGAEEKKD